MILLLKCFISLLKALTFLLLIEQTVTKLTNRRKNKTLERVGHATSSSQRLGLLDRTILSKSLRKDKKNGPKQKYPESKFQTSAKNTQNPTKFSTEKTHQTPPQT